MKAQQLLLLVHFPLEFLDATKARKSGAVSPRGCQEKEEEEGEVWSANVVR